MFVGSCEEASNAAAVSSPWAQRVAGPVLFYWLPPCSSRTAAVCLRSCSQGEVKSCCSVNAAKFLPLEGAVPHSLLHLLVSVAAMPDWRL
ncbi:hypothetical protein NDU88_006003 [Pleurodeles waltl]|uniref:Secreted protein n=1 Tax=Pleurodeles waltl TaxID=8319 RepID=A0AAV7X176_PLEWA|nr:hypothetical protein NDU88_006003 [Pleurodeles waltl]